MLVEVRKYFKWSSIGNATLDKDASTPKHEITEAEAKKIMEVLSCLGYKRHENATQIFYDKVWNCHQTEEYIFYKSIVE